MRSIFYFYTGAWSNSNKMPSPQVLQPVLKKKVDELFLNWLSDPETQSTLKEYLDLIKNGQYVNFSSGEAQEKKSLSFNENNNVASHKNLAEKKPAPIGTPSTPQSSSTLPTRSSSNARVTGLNGRVSRRSVSTKKVSYQSNVVLNRLAGFCHLLNDWASDHKTKMWIVISKTDVVLLGLKISLFIPSTSCVILQKLFIRQGDFVKLCSY